MIKSAEKIKKLVAGILKKMKIKGDLILVSKDDCVRINLENSPDSALLIGYQGETLRALQLIARIIIQNQQLLNDDQRVVLDVDSYLNKKDEDLKNMAQEAVDSVLKSKRSLELRPMTSYERRIIHMTLAKEKNISTESLGEGSARRIIIRLK